jgi:hypothetical protein
MNQAIFVIAQCNLTCYADVYVEYYAQQRMKRTLTMKVIATNPDSLAEWDETCPSCGAPLDCVSADNGWPHEESYTYKCPECPVSVTKHFALVKLEIEYGESVLEHGE